MPRYLLGSVKDRADLFHCFSSSPKTRQSGLIRNPP
jgi:hypothetical protein